MTTSGTSMKMGAWLLIAVVGVIAYLPAVDNFFISDDFVLLSVVKDLDEHPLHLLDMPSELFRLMSYVYFWICFRSFGAVNAEPYYWAGITLHVLVSLLVMALVQSVTGRWLAASAAGLFFAGYERHQEAVMWISAMNDTILTLNCLIFLLLWRRYLSRSVTGYRPVFLFALSLAMFILSLFSKEGAVALTPLSVLGLVLAGGSWRNSIHRCLPLAFITLVYGLFWLSKADDNFFVTKGLYAFTPYFFPVYARSVLRILSPTLIFWFPLLLVNYYACEDSRDRRTQIQARLRNFMREPSYLYFTAIVFFGVIPYSFLLYLNHIPSRNSYFPSVGLAGLVGLLFAGLYDQVRSPWGRRATVTFFLSVVLLNIAYIWTKKEPQFRARAAPTRQLISVLSQPGTDNQRSATPITVCNFPLDPWIGRETVVGFTSLEVAQVIFSQECNDSAPNAVRWDESSQTYVGVVRAQSALTN